MLHSSLPKGSRCFMRASLGCHRCFLGVPMKMKLSKLDSWLFSSVLSLFPARFVAVFWGTGMVLLALPDSLLLLGVGVWHALAARHDSWLCCRAVAAWSRSPARFRAVFGG